jgi:hypothetical protein
MKMQTYEIKVAKVVYRTTKEFNTNEEARMWAMAKRDDHIFDDNKVEYFFEVEEISNV